MTSERKGLRIRAGKADPTWLLTRN